MEHNTHQTGGILPLEIAECIIESIGDQDLAPTLFPLLTVSKDMFSAAVRRLYANPIKSVRSCRYPVRALHRLLALIARICPRVDQALLEKHILVTGLSLPPRTTVSSFPTHMTALSGHLPHADYFSFVRVLDNSAEFEHEIQQIIWTRPYQQEEETVSSYQREQDAIAAYEQGREAMAAAAAFSQSPTREQFNVGHTTDTPDIEEPLPGELLSIFWMACETSHLGKVRQISIHPDQISKCGYMLEHMTGIEAIDCHFEDRGDVYITNQLCQVTKALSRLPIMQQWRAQEQQPGHLESSQACPRRRPFRFELHAYNDKRMWYHEALYQPLRELFAAVSGDTTTRVAAIYADQESERCDPNWVRFFVMPESIDLANVRSICQYVRGDFLNLALPWPRCGKGAILQQCRGLRELKVYVAEEDEEEEGPTLFAWAREERQQMLSNASKDHGCSQKWILSGSAGSSLSHSQGLVQLETLCLAAPGGMTMEQSVQDALFAFGPTLQHISLNAGMLEIDLARFQHLPVLRELDIRSSSIQYSTLSSGEGNILESNDVFPRLENIALHEYGTGEPPETWETLVWPHMQRLSRITLTGLVTYRVPQAVLAVYGSQLQELAIHSDCWVPDPVRRTYVWNMEHWQQMTKLQVLRLYGPMATAFRISMLATCPDLWRLDLAANIAWGMGLEEMRLGQCFDVGHFAEGIWIDGATGVDRSASNVRQLYLSGWEVSSTVVEQVLPAMFPALERLKIFDCYSDPISEEQRERIYAQLPKLKEIVWKSRRGWKRVIKR